MIELLRDIGRTLLGLIMPGYLSREDLVEESLVTPTTLRILDEDSHVSHDED